MPRTQRLNRLVILPLACALLTAAAAAGSAALRTEKLKGYGAMSVKQSVEVVSERAVVKFRPGITAEVRNAALASVGAKYVRDFPDGWAGVALSPGMTVKMGLDLLNGLPQVIEVAPDLVYRPVKYSNDPQIFNQYHLGKVNAYAAWEYGVGDSTQVTVAVMDSGIEGTHEDLSPKIDTVNQAHQRCSPGASDQVDDGGGCVNNTPPTVSCSHGTEVSGVAAAATGNGTGIAGVSWGAKLLSLNVFNNCNVNGDCSPAGCWTDDWAMQDALQYAIARQNQAGYGRIVVNISLGAPGGSCAGFLQTTITNAYNAGIPIIVSAGNDGAGVNAPGNCANVIPVGATDENDAIAFFSSTGTQLSDNGVVAPGVDIRSTTIGNAYTAGLNGTSFSAPIVAGVAALMLAETGIFTGNPSSTWVDTVKNNIRNSAQGIGVAGVSGTRPSGLTSGAGRVNAFRAMKLTVEGTLAGFDGDEKAIAFPNPFKPTLHGAATITIPTSLEGRNPEIKIYTIDGQLVRKLGGNTSWDGKNDGGSPVATGTYVFYLKTDTGEQSGRVAVIR